MESEEEDDDFGLVEYFLRMTGLVLDTCPPLPLAPPYCLVLATAEDEGVDLLSSFDPQEEGAPDKEFWGGKPKSRPP